MNYKFIIFVLVIFAGFSCAQEGITPPDTILNEFNRLYPDIEDVEWEKEGDNFEAEFYKDGNEISVEFNAQGEVLKTEIEGQKESDKTDDEQGNEDTDSDDNDDED